MPVPFRRTPLAAAVGAALVAPLPAHAFPIFPAGDEFELAQDTGNTDQLTPDVAISDSGTFVAVWADGGEIIAQRYALDGTRQGGEITVPRAEPGNTAPRSVPVVAMDADGDFAVAWQADYPSLNSLDEVAFQRFDASGNPVASARRATDDVIGPTNQQAPAIAMDEDGDIVIAWEGYVSATDTNGIGYRLFNAANGAATGTQAAASDPAGNSVNAAVSRSGAGEFAISWFNDSGNVFVRRFGAGGAPLAGNEITVASVSIISPSESDVAMDDDGDFAVAWDEYYGPSYEVSFRAFRIDGSEFIGPTLVSNSADGAPTIAMLDSDETVIAWEEAGSVFISAFDGTGNRENGTLTVNQATTGTQGQPSIAMDPDGEAVVAFETYLSAADEEVLARRFTRRIITGTGGGPGSLGWLGALGLGLAAVGRKLFSRRRRRGGGLAGLLAGALALGSVGGAPPAEAAEPPVAGSVEEVAGNVTAVRPGVSARSLAYGDPLYTGDRVRTGAGARAVLRLADGTRVSLRADSEFRVSEVRRRQNEDGSTTLSGMFMDLLQGGLRMITGSVANRDPESYQLHTPVATIGVRGTEFEARLCARGACPEEAGTAADGPAPAARVLRIEGVARAEGPNGAPRVLETGAGIFRDDTVTTADDAWVVLQFADRSKVSLQPGTAFRVDEWEFDRADPGDGNALLNLLRGGMRVLTGLIGSEATEDYQVQTPVATIGVRGTGFDLQCIGACVDPGVQALGSIQGDGLLVHSWDGEMFFRLDGRIAEFQAGQTGFLANASANPLRLPGVPQLLQDLPAPRPDTVGGALPEGGERLYTRVEDGAITVQGARGAPLAVGAGEAALVPAGGAAQPIAGAPGILGEGLGAASFTLAGALGELWAAQFDLGTWYAGGTTGTTVSGSRSEFENRLQDDFPNASVESLEGGLGGRVFGGFRLLGLAGVEIGYADLGDITSEIDPGTNDPSQIDQVAEAALDEHPFAPTGIDVSAIVATTVDVTGTTRAFARTGVFFWEGDIETVTPSGQRFSKDVSGSDPLIGGGVEYRIGPNMHARAEWIQYRLDPDPVNYVGAGVVWTLP